MWVSSISPQVRVALKISWFPCFSFENDDTSPDNGNIIVNRQHKQSTTESRRTLKTKPTLVEL